MARKKKGNTFVYSIKRTKKNIVTIVRERIYSANDALVILGELPDGIDQSRVVVEPPRDPSHGELASNDAMVLAKESNKEPHQLAEAVAQQLREDSSIEKVTVAQPGFVNVTLKPEAWTTSLRVAIERGENYGRSYLGRGRRVSVEFVSANPTGPMHVGHGRGAVFGDALANLLAFTGFKVTREYYINDAGAQVDVLARSAYLRYREVLGEDIGVIPEGLYPGEYVKEAAYLIGQQYGDALRDRLESEWLPVVRDLAINTMMRIVREDLDALNIKHDVFFSERSLTGRAKDEVADTIEWLRTRGYIYQGRLPPPKKPVDDWEDREQTLFRSTAFGDDIDRPLIKSDGSYTYFASDIAYHRSKLKRGFRTLIDVWGADHGGYVKRMQAAVAALSNRKAELDVKLVQLVKLLRAGEPVKMSKRAGEFVTLREVVDEVGRDAVRFMMLFRKNDAALDFDLAKVIEQSRDNPVFYVQYGHARGQSVFRNARDVFPDLPADMINLLEVANLDLLVDPAELALMRQIALYPRVIEGAAVAHEPHRIAFYLYDLASEFHALWTLGNASPHLRFIIQNDRELTLARLVLIQGVVTVLASGLGLLGVAAPDEMR